MQYPQRVFTMIAGHTGEFVEDLAAFPPARRPITFSHRLFEFSPCRHAQFPRHPPHHPAAPLPGSSLREATAADPVTKIVSQCALVDNWLVVDIAKHALEVTRDWIIRVDLPIAEVANQDVVREYAKRQGRARHAP